MRNVGLILLLVSLLVGAAPAKERKKSLYARLGGAYAIAAVVDDFINNLLKDPVIVANPKVVAAMNNINVPGLKFHITNMLCAATGGPETYTGRDMATSHKHMAITEAEWNAMAGDLQKTLKDFDVPAPEQAELLTLLGGLKEKIVKP